jgi:hypothetical protein
MPPARLCLPSTFYSVLLAFTLRVIGPRTGVDKEVNRKTYIPYLYITRPMNIPLGMGVEKSGQSLELKRSVSEGPGKQEHKNSFFSF